MFRLYIYTTLILLTGCTSQMTYDGVVYLVNSCQVKINVTAKNYTGSIASQDGHDPETLSLLPKERGIIAVFSLASLQQDFSGHFTDGNKDFTVIISDGHNEKVLKGSEIYRRMENVTTQRNLKSRSVVYEISDGSICQK